MSGPTDAAERIRMYGKLFTMYPPATGTIKDAIAVWVDETRDLPPLLISHALKRLTQRHTGQFAPKVAEIRREAAHVLRETHRCAIGLDPTSGLPEDGINVAGWLAKAHEPIPTARQLAPGPTAPAEEKATPEQRAQGAALLEAYLGPLAKEKQVP